MKTQSIRRTLWMRLLLAPLSLFILLCITPRAYSQTDTGISAQTISITNGYLYWVTNGSALYAPVGNLSSPSSATTTSGSNITFLAGAVGGEPDTYVIDQWENEIFYNSTVIWSDDNNPASFGTAIAAYGGGVVIADWGAEQILSSSGGSTPSVIAGVGYYDGSPGDGGPASEAEFFQPIGVGISSTGLYVLDGCELRVLSGGYIYRVAGGTDPTDCSEGAPFDAPNTLAVDPVMGYIYIADDGDIYKLGTGVIGSGVNTNDGSYLAVWDGNVYYQGSGNEIYLN